MKVTNKNAEVTRSEKKRKARRRKLHRPCSIGGREKGEGVKDGRETRQGERSGCERGRGGRGDGEGKEEAGRVK